MFCFIVTVRLAQSFSNFVAEFELHLLFRLSPVLFLVKSYLMCVANIIIDKNTEQKWFDLNLASPMELRARGQ